MIRSVWITSLTLLCGISTCIDVTWTWIERDPNPKWDVGYMELRGEPVAVCAHDGM